VAIVPLLGEQNYVLNFEVGALVFIKALDGCYILPIFSLRYLNNVNI